MSSEKSCSEWSEDPSVNNIASEIFGGKCTNFARETRRDRPFWHTPPGFARESVGWTYFAWLTPIREFKQVNAVYLGYLDTSAQVLLISVLYFYHKMNEMKCEWWLHGADVTERGGTLVHIMYIGIYFLLFIILFIFLPLLSFIVKLNCP